MSTAGTIYEVLQNHNSIQPGVLRCLSTTQLRFDPVGSNRIKINGVWRPLPAAGITTSNVAFINGVANQTLAAGTQYYVYAFWDGAAVKIDFSHLPTGIRPRCSPAISASRSRPATTRAP